MSRRGSRTGRGATQGVVGERGGGVVRRQQRGQARGAGTGRRSVGRGGAALQPVTQAQAVVNMPEQRRLRIMVKYMITGMQITTIKVIIKKNYSYDLFVKKTKKKHR